MGSAKAGPIFFEVSGPVTSETASTFCGCSMSEPERVLIFDTTLRDGQQCPGAGLNFAQNLEYAELAAQAGIDVLEAGFPSASRLDFEIVRAIAEQLSLRESAPVVAALCQLREDQIDKTIEALEPAAKSGRGRLHVYLPVDPQLMRASLGDQADDKPGLVKDLFDMCLRARQHGLEVEFSPEGYSRQGENFDFVTDLIRAAVQAGAKTINCPDTIGGAAWMEGPDYFVEKMKLHAEIIAREFPNCGVVWSTHCHNDFGLALQNSLAAVFTGPARQIEGCFNGIGERAGNTSLEQCIMVIRHFGHRFDPERRFLTEVSADKIQALSDFVAKWMLPRQPHWPISGDNAARHSSGGHTNAILKNPLAYQPFDPNEIGKDISFVFGPLSGGNHAKSIIEGAGYVCGEDEKTAIAQYIKDSYSTRRKGVTDGEVVQAYVQYRSPIIIDRFGYSKRRGRSEIELTGKFFDFEGDLIETLEGEDSALAVLKLAISKRFAGFQFDGFQSEAIGTGVSAYSRSSIRIIDQRGKPFIGTGDDRDIEISAMKALIDSVNKAYVDQMYRSEGSSL